MKVLQSISAFLSRQTPAFISLVAVFAFFVPGVFSWVHGTSQTVVLGVIMLTMGMTLTGDDFRILAARPFDIAIGAVAQFALMPLIAFSLVHLLGMPKGIAAGLILVGCCPGGVSSNIMSFLCKGDVAFSVAMTSLSTLCAPLATPFLMYLLAGERVPVDAVGMFKSILVVTILPVAIGFACNAVFARRQGWDDAKKLMPGVAVIGLACIVGGVVSAHGHQFLKSGWMIFLGVFLHNALGYVLGYATGVMVRFTRPKRRTISIEVGMQNAGLATVLAARHFPQMPEVAIASAVSCVWHSISGALLAGIFNTLDSWTDRKGR